MNAIQDLLGDVGISDGLIGVGISILVFIVAFLLIFGIGKLFVLPTIERFLKTRGVELHARQPLMKVMWFSLVFVSLGIAVGAAGYGNLLTSLATIAAAATLAIGFALQDLLRNLAAGVFIFIDRPFKIGDWIEWNDNAGIVDDISLRVTRVKTFDNELLTVPNSQLTDNVVKNPVAEDRLRIKPTFGIGYEDDIGQATDIIIEEANAHPDILDEPEPAVRLVELGDSAVGLQSRIWLDDPTRADFLKIRSEFVTAVKEHFDEVGISIPYPQRELSGQLALEE